MRFIFTLLLFLFFLNYKTIGQNNTITKYYDSSWIVTSKTNAYYFVDYIQIDSIIKATGYWTNSGKIKYIIYYSDTAKNIQVGLSKKYYENGQIEDSSIYNKEGKITTSFYFYPDGKIWVRYFDDNGTQTTEAYDQNGVILKDFIYFREAEFPGGNMEWQSFLADKIKSKVPIKNGAPAGQYQVIVRFIVSTNGKITEIEAETNLGYGMEEEVIRVIRKSPKWIQAIWLNKPINAYRRQPLTFVVSEL